MTELIFEYDFPEHQWTYAFYSIMRPMFLNAEPSSPLGAQREACVRRISQPLWQPLNSPDHLLQLAQLLEEAHPGMFAELQQRALFAFSLHRALPPDFWADYLRICFEKGSQNDGWSDITVIADDAVRFIEVKYHDKLRPNQIAWLSNVAEPLQLDISVLIAQPTA